MLVKDGALLIELYYCNKRRWTFLFRFPFLVTRLIISLRCNVGDSIVRSSSLGFIGVPPLQYLRHPAEWSSLSWKRVLGPLPETATSALSSSRGERCHDFIFCRCCVCDIIIILYEVAGLSLVVWTALLSALSLLFVFIILQHRSIEPSNPKCSRGWAQFRQLLRNLV